MLHIKNIHTERLQYQVGETICNGYMAYDVSVKELRPAVLIAHAWKGQDQFAKEKAEQIAALGYIGFAVDNYGDGKVAISDEEASDLMMPLFIDRARLRSYMKKAFEVVACHPMVDRSRIGVIGYCFGGLAAIELFRSGVDVKAAVSFHALLGSSQAGVQAVCEPIAKGIQGSLLMLHGHQDPLVSSEDIALIQQEMTDEHIDWQMHVYGQSSHAFTNYEANNAAAGLLYNAIADARSWRSMKEFFHERFTLS